MTSKMEIGRVYRVQVLHLLTRLGYMTTRQVAMCLFGGCSDSDRKQASRTIRWLLHHNYVKEKRANGSASERMVALTRAGVHALQHDVALMNGKGHGRDWLRHEHPHRTACNSVWSACYRGLDEPGWTELEIRSGLAPNALSQFQFRTVDGEQAQKIPDLLLKDDGRPPVWVEVEHSWRGEKDFRKLISFLRHMFTTDKPGVHQVWFVITAEGAKSIGKRLRKVMTHGPDSGYTMAVKALDARILAERIKVFQLDSQSLEMRAIQF